MYATALDGAISILLLLPLIFLIWIVNWIDRVNVAFANPRMSADLGFSDRVYSKQGDAVGRPG
jgi:hypothetical protein